ncbi:MAG: hypothetical protein JHC38_00185 [Thiotrichales bacterium]|jgi:hypothetical protein|nr:hypothetical protein [Thiotrichales bacterium]
MLNSKRLTPHRPNFDRIGGFDQVGLQTDEDWRSLSSLDPKLWAVLSCPTSAMAISADASALLDTDNDSRICVNEVVSAVQWRFGIIILLMFVFFWQWFVVSENWLTRANSAHFL